MGRSSNDRQTYRHTRLKNLSRTDKATKKGLKYTIIPKFYSKYRKLSQMISKIIHHDESKGQVNLLNSKLSRMNPLILEPYQKKNTQNLSCYTG